MLDCFGAQLEHVESAGEQKVLCLEASPLDPIRHGSRVCSVISNWTGRWVFCCMTIARAAMRSL
jgi:hypothetical protein